VVTVLLLVSETADRLFMTAASSAACTVTSSEFCVRLTNKLAAYTPADAAKKHFANCTQNKSIASCLNASILYTKLENTVFTVLSLNQACALGDKNSCQQGYRAAQRYIEESQANKISAKDMKARLQLALTVYTKGCEVGEGESCALAARSPLTSAKSVYSFFYRGCYSLNHPTACIGLADYFKGKGQSKLAENAVNRICKGKRSLACTDLIERLSDSKSAQSRMISSTKYN
jgi:hypothetical protein